MNQRWDYDREAAKRRTIKEPPVMRGLVMGGAIAAAFYMLGMVAWMFAA